METYEQGYLHPEDDDDDMGTDPWGPAGEPEESPDDAEE